MRKLLLARQDPGTIGSVAPVEVSAGMVNGTGSRTFPALAAFILTADRQADITYRKKALSAECQLPGGLAGWARWKKASRVQSCHTATQGGSFSGTQDRALTMHWPDRWARRILRGPIPASLCERPNVLPSIRLSPRSRVLPLTALLLCVIQAGCGVQRRLTIRSNPPGALVYVDDQEIGYTPVSTPFTYYGTRKVTLIRDGYETVTVKEKIRAPWYQIPPLDFFSENLWPRQLRDERILNFQLYPQQIVPTEQLRERAESLRGSARQGVFTPVPTAVPQAGGGF